MRNGLIGLVSAMVLASTMAIVGCGSGGGTGTTGGSSSSGGTTATGGSSSSGGTTATGGSSSGGGTGTAGASGAGSVTNLSGSRALSDLTKEEATQLCNDTNAYFGKAIPKATWCKWKGLAFAVSSSAPTDTMLQANCAGQETACLQGTPETPSCSDIPSTCTATVTQYSACVTAQAESYTKVVGGLASCAKVTRPDLQGVWDFMSGDLPANCLTLTNICPSLDAPIPQ
jgi:hypothetical protein